MKDLREFTTARVRLGDAGGSLPTRALLEVRLAHARARDAVYWPLDLDDFRRELGAKGWLSLVVQSAARNREEYLRRPDLGRSVSSASCGELAQLRCAGEMVFLVGDGLSALAVQRHAIPLLERIFASLGHTPSDSNPVLVAGNARVALADEVGAAAGAALSVLLIGERPGLSSPDSLGVYLTWQPRPGRTDAERNCISNIHPAGLSYEAAGMKVAFLTGEMKRRKLSGVMLKDESALITSRTQRGGLE